MGIPNESPDGPLVRRVLEGDAAAFAGLVARYRDRLGRYAMRMLGNQADAEEALQDTFVRAYKSLGRCTDPDRFGAWLFGILVNRCRTHGAQRARRERLLVTDEVALATASVGDAAEGHAWRETIAWALARIPPVYREAFLLKHVEDRSYEEMERLTGASVPALKMRVVRAREMLRRLLQEAENA
jgi:RNA polymerase sigma-70 factor (ECF subfamily)